MLFLVQATFRQVRRDALGVRRRCPSSQESAPANQLRSRHSPLDSARISTDKAEVSVLFRLSSPRYVMVFIVALKPGIDFEINDNSDDHRLST